MKEGKNPSLQGTDLMWDVSGLPLVSSLEKTVSPLPSDFAVAVPCTGVLLVVNV